MIFSLKTISEMTGREAFCVERLRSGVFISKQKVTMPEIDDEDFYAVHAFTLNKSKDNALITCRIFKKESGIRYLGRVVISKDMRGMRLGSKVAEEAHYYLGENGVDRLYCYTQMTARPLYDYPDYQVRGSILNEASINHVLVYKDL